MKAMVIKPQPFIILEEIAVDDQGVSIGDPIGVVLAYNSADAFYLARLRWPEAKILEPLPWAIVPPPIRLTVLKIDRMFRSDFVLVL
jgi:hypothetical protein